MQEFKSFSKRLDSLPPNQFDDFALELFEFQAHTNAIYKSYLAARSIDSSKVRRVEDIPFLPIRFFKDQKVVTGNKQDFEFAYASSGTTGAVTSRHFLWSPSWYVSHAQKLFEKEYGPLRNFHVLGLLPGYLERPDSSLVAMTQHFITQTKSPYSGFYLYNQKELARTLENIPEDGRKVLLLGVTFALLDFAESMTHRRLPSELIVMETGGMKGRRREMIREEVHDRLMDFFQVNAIHSEYGMTELLSQAYSKGGGKYTIPYSMRVLLRDMNDPFSAASKLQGGINVIDLANFHSCAFVETQDLGKLDQNGFLEVLGRFDHAELRGCNLLVQ
ncbi:MAG: acyl transferase [Bacteroidetes bacterium]|nr:acyl transferase [Bacteroidota bacterium]